MYSIESFTECDKKEVQQIEGGLALGGLVGGILGGTVGLLAGTIATAVTGDASGKTLWKWTVTGALSGGAIGLATPL